jgi:hypothetical protein
MNMATGKGKRKKRGRKGAPDNPEQSKRFVEAAKKLGLEGNGDAFEKAMRELLKAKPKRGSS